jgi:hypothetical protein
MKTHVRPSAGSIVAVDPRRARSRDGELARYNPNDYGRLIPTQAKAATAPWPIASSPALVDEGLHDGFWRRRRAAFRTRRDRHGGRDDVTDRQRVVVHDTH